LILGAKEPILEGETPVFVQSKLEATEATATELTGLCSEAGGDPVTIPPTFKAAEFELRQCG
jgi:hypothetical protein